MRHRNPRALQNRLGHPVLRVLRDHPVLQVLPALRDRLQDRSVHADLRGAEDREDGPVRQGHPAEPEAHPAVHGGRSLHQGLPVPRGVPVAAVDPLVAPRGAGAPAGGPADVEEW